MNFRSRTGCPAHISTARKTGADLGMRMAAALGRCLAYGRRAVLIGTDFPDLPHEVLIDAFENLDSGDDAEITLGPRGGRGLLPRRDETGTSRIFFAGIPWSTGEVFIAHDGESGRARGRDFAPPRMARRGRCGRYGGPERPPRESQRLARPAYAGISLLIRILRLRRNN